MGAWHSNKPGYSAVEDQPFAVPTPPSQKSSGFTRVGGGRAHFDTPYAIQSDSRASLDRQSLVPNHGITSPEPDYNPPPVPPKFGTTSTNTSTPSVGNFQSSGSNNNPPAYSVNGDGGGGPPAPTIVRAAGRQNLPHGAMPPAHFRVQSQSAIVVHPGLTDPFTGSSGPRNGTGASNTPGKTPSPLRPPIRYVSEDSPTPNKKPWFRALRNKGHSDSGVPVDEEADLPTDAGGGSTSGRSFLVVRKDQGQSHNKRPSTSGSSGDDPGQKKGSFVVLRGRDAQPDRGHGGLS